jgi:hypothetical protein
MQKRELSKLPKLYYVIFILFSSLALLLAINQIFRFRIFGFLPMDTAYLYYLISLYLSLAFILYPAKNPLPWIKFLGMMLYCFR